MCKCLGAFFRSHETIDLTSVKAVAIIKPCCLGDVLMSTPTIKAARDAFPDARLDYYVGSWSRRAVEGNPNVDNIIDCGSVGAGRYSVGEYLTLIRRLRQGKYGVCFVLERSVFITLAPLLAGIPQRVGLDSEGRGFPLTVKVPCGEVKHEAELYLDTARAIGVDVDNPRLEFHPSDTDVARAHQLLQDAGLAIDDSSANTPIVIIHPAGGANPGMKLPAKRWPAERFAAVADRVIDEYGATLLIVGAESDIPVAAEMERKMQRQVVNLAGKTTIGELAAAFTFSHLFLGNDTGPLHLAVSVGIPVVAIFGPTDARVYGPYSDEATTVCSNVACRPCFVKGATRPCRAYDCITSISIDQVWAAVQHRLEANGFRKLNSVAKRSV